LSASRVSIRVSIELVGFGRMSEETQFEKLYDITRASLRATAQSQLANKMVLWSRVRNPLFGPTRMQIRRGVIAALKLELAE